MKRIAILISYACLVFLATLVLSAGVGAQEKEEDFTFEDVFMTRKAEEKISFHGYVAFQYFDSEDPGPGGNRSFDQHIFEPFFGYQVTDEVFAKIIVEFEHAPEKVDDSQYAEIFIEQAEIDITPRQGTTVAFGAILVPFGLENYFHSPSDNRLISRPPIAKSGANSNSILNNTWTDVGIQLIQDVPKVGTLDLYVINGTAVQTKADRGRDTKSSFANSGKSLGAELQITDLYPGLNVGFSYIKGPHDTANDLYSWRLGLHALLDLEMMYLQAEYLAGIDEGIGSISAGADRDVSGYYIMVSLVPPLPKIGDRLDLNFRYTDWTADDDTGNEFSEIASGARFRLYENTWVKAEYQINSEDGSNPDSDNNRFGLQLSVLF
jgi:hypothetical protein